MRAEMVYTCTMYIHDIHAYSPEFRNVCIHYNVLRNAVMHQNKNKLARYTFNTEGNLFSFCEQSYIIHSLLLSFNL